MSDGIFLSFPDEITWMGQGHKRMLVATKFAFYRVVFRNGAPRRYKKIKDLKGVEKGMSVAFLDYSSSSKGWG